MKKTLFVSLLSVGSLFISNQVHAQTCDITLNATHVQATTPDQNSAFVLLANKHYCVTGDQSTILGNRKIKIENGATLTINSGAKFKVNQFVTPSAADGIFKVVVKGKLLFEQTNIETNGVDITVENGGYLGSGDWQGNTTMQDIKFANTSNNNKIMVQQGGEIKANVITFGKNNNGGRFEIDNYGLITTTGNINMDATTIFRNPGEIQVGQSFNQNATSKFINCGEIYTGTSFNIGGGEVINTNLFISHDSRIDFGNAAGGIFRNYSIVEVKSLNISSTQNSGYFYNEGIVELKETGDNVFGGNFGKIKGPESTTKRGYFILNNSGAKTNPENIKIEGNLNFYLKNASPHNTLQNVFNIQNNQHNVNTSTVTFVPCNGQTGCGQMPTPNLVYGACPNMNGTFESPKVTLAHDPAGNGTNNGNQLTTLPTVYAYIVDRNGIVKEKYNLTTGTNNKRENDLQTSGSTTNPEQNDYSGYKVVLSTTNVNVNASAPQSVAPEGWAFTKNDINNSNTKNNGAIANLSAGALESINFGIQKLPTAENKQWTVKDYQTNMKYPLGIVPTQTPGGQNSYVRLNGNDEDGNVVGFKITSLPSTDSAKLFYNGAPVTTSTLIEDLSLLEIQILNAPNPDQNESFTFKYVAIDAAGGQSKTPAVYTVTSSNSNGSPLKLEHIEIFAKNTQSGNLVEWSIVHSTPNDIAEFVIERSANAKDFNAIGNVRPNTISETNSRYTFIDKQPFAGNNFYRIKVTEHSGIVSYSGLVNQINKGTSIVSVYPNPAQDQLNVLLSNKGTYNVTLTDLSGKILKTQNVTVAANEVIKIGRTQFASGVYIIKVTDELGNATSQNVVFN